MGLTLGWGDYAAYVGGSSVITGSLQEKVGDAVLGASGVM